MKLWKDLRTNLMYWRFRNITRNRLRLQSWWYRRRNPVQQYRPRGTATFVYRGSSRKVWVVLLLMVALLTAVSVAKSSIGLNPTIAYLLSACIIIGAIYWALRGL